MPTSPRQSGYWQLFRSVQPLFASEIPWELLQEDQHGNIERPKQDGQSQGQVADKSGSIAIIETGALIKICMEEAPMHVLWNHFDFVDGYVLPITDDLRVFLFSLQKLVNDNITERVCVDATNCVDQDFRNLYVLGQLITKNSMERPFDMQQYLPFICLAQRPEQLKQVLSGIERLNRELVSELELCDSSQRPAPKSESHQPTEWLLARYDSLFWSSAQTLFESLAQELECGKSSQHLSMLNVKTLLPPRRSERIEFSVLLSMCSEHHIWQETSCQILGSSSMTEQAHDEYVENSLCETAQTAKDITGVLHFQVHENNFCYYWSTQTPLYSNVPCTISLSQLIQDGLLINHRNFPPIHRAALALNLAQNLLLLHGGNWIQKLWTPENIFYLHESLEQGRELRNLHNPFIFCTFSENPPRFEKTKPYDRYALLYAFGQFLLELGLGEKLPTKVRPNGDIDPWLTLNKNCTSLNLSCLPDHLQDAITGCRDFKEFLMNERTDLQEDERIRVTIFKRIVQPLERYLASYSRSSIDGRIEAQFVGREESRSYAYEDTHRVYGQLNRYTTGETPRRPKSSQSHTSTIGMVKEEITNCKTGKHQSLTAESSRIDYIGSSQSFQNLHSLVNIPDEDLRRQIPARAKGQEFEQGDGSPSEQSNEYSDSDSEVCRSLGVLGSFDITSDKSLDPQTSPSLKWGTTFKAVSSTFSRYFQHSSSDQPIKVAIFDTGIDLGHPNFQECRSKFDRGKGKVIAISPKTGEKKQIDRINEYQNFCDDQAEDDVSDIDGHGTHVAGIILQLAPRAELYIARVSQGDAKRSPDPNEDVLPEQLKQPAIDKKVHPGAVIDAITWAIKHKVDIINMSFGFPVCDVDLLEALQEAKKQNILVIAAGSNSGNHTKTPWPARDPEIAICVHSSNDAGTRSSDYVPSADTNTTHFMIVGEKIYSHWPVSKGGGYRPMSGSSTATPVATAIAALLLAYTEQDAVMQMKKKVEREIGAVKLRELEKMRTLLKGISKEDNKYHWIQPRLLWSDHDTRGNDPSAAASHAWGGIRSAFKR